MAAALAASAGAIEAVVLGRPPAHAPWAGGSASAVCAFLFALPWLAMFQSPRASARVRWTSSIPFAALASAAWASVYLLQTARTSSQRDIFIVALVGLGPGIVIWAPTLVATLALLGPPLEIARQRAREGMFGRDRGDRLLAAVAVAFAAWSVPLSVAGGVSRSTWVTASLALLAVVAGGAAGARAQLRIRARRRLLDGVRSGQRPELAFQPTGNGGRVVQRAVLADAYRGAAFGDAVADVDAEGELQLPRHAPTH